MELLLRIIGIMWKQVERFWGCQKAKTSQKVGGEWPFDDKNSAYFVRRNLS